LAAISFDQKMIRRWQKPATLLLSLGWTGRSFEEEVLLGHPRLFLREENKTWMPAPRVGMTEKARA